MTRLTALMVLVYCLLTGHCYAEPSTTQDARLSDAIAGIESLIREDRADVAVALRTLDGKTQWLFRADERFHAASTMKVGVLIELYHQVRDGKIKLSDTLTVKNTFRSLADGSPYALNPADDSETDLYKAVGDTRTLEQLSELMITVSSNLATNLLMEKLGVDNIRASVHGLGRGRHEHSSRSRGRESLRQGAQQHDYRAGTNAAHGSDRPRSGRGWGFLKKNGGSARAPDF